MCNISLCLHFYFVFVQNCDNIVCVKCKMYAVARQINKPGSRLKPFYLNNISVLLFTSKTPCLRVKYAFMYG